MKTNIYAIIFEEDYLHKVTNVIDCYESKFFDWKVAFSGCVLTKSTFATAEEVADYIRPQIGMNHLFVLNTNVDNFGYLRPGLWKFIDQK